MLDSMEVLNHLIDSLKVKDLIEKAERAAAKGNNKRAKNLYTDALYILDRSERLTSEAGDVADKIRLEIEKLDAFSAGAE